MFWGDHSFAHDTYANQIQLLYNQNTTYFPIGGEGPLNDWIGLYRQVPKGGKKPQMTQQLLDWLSMHDSMHRSEITVLNLGDPIDLATVDFTDQGQFQSWLYTHQALHDLTDGVLGL